MYRVIILLAITALLAIGILYYAETINSFFHNDIADRILLLVIILVDSVGIVMPPWIEIRINDTRERNKRLTEECIAKLELNPSADDEHILTIPSSSSEGYTNVSARVGIKPPYFQEMKARLQNYPKLWKLVQELPMLYKNTKGAYEISVGEIREKLENVAKTKNLTFTKSRDDVISELTNKLSNDIMNASPLTDYPVQEMLDRIGDVMIGPLMLSVPLSTARALAGEMVELRKNPVYGQKFKSMKNDFERVDRGRDEFTKERNEIVEEIRLSHYKNLKGIPWYKRLDC